MSVKLIKSDLNVIRSILTDLKFKSEFTNNDETHIKLFKLLKARENNPDFEIELATRISGDNTKYPYRSSFFITKFFKELGFNYVHDGSTRRIWISKVLRELSIYQILKVIENGLFRRKDFFKPELSLEENDDRYNLAKKDFKEFIDLSVKANLGTNLIDILDLNVNLELLFENKANTNDIVLNSLIEESKSRFLNQNDKYIAIEKLWDSFERIKTYFDSGKQKASSAEKLVNIVSIDFDFEIINEEFIRLTKIGNTFRIRHFETDKLEIKHVRHLNYLYFRMLALIDLCIFSLSSLNEEGNI